MLLLQNAHRRPLRGAAAHLCRSYYRVLKKREGVIGKAA
jgi:DNA-3-methyladenine glycosylase II